MRRGAGAGAPAVATPRGTGMGYSRGDWTSVSTDTASAQLYSSFETNDYMKETLGKFLVEH